MTDVLVIAGDISETQNQTLQAIERLQSLCEFPVYYVPGNHDMWNKNCPECTTEEIDRIYREDLRCLSGKPVILEKDGSIYLLDVRRTGSRKMEQERILKYDRNGKMVQVVSDIRYDENERVYKNAINRIDGLDGKIVWFQFTGDGFSIMSQDGELRHFRYEEAEQYLVDFAINPATGFCTYLTKSGEIYEEQENGSFRKVYSADDNKLQIPWYIDYSRDGELYFADIGTRGIYRVENETDAVLVMNTTGSAAPQELSEDELRESPIYYNFDMGDRLATTDTYGVIVGDLEQKAEISDGVPH